MFSLRQVEMIVEGVSLWPSRKGTSTGFDGSWISGIQDFSGKSTCIHFTCVYYYQKST